MLTYGSIVTQLLHDLNSDPIKVNAQLDKMGFQMGCRLIEEFVSKAQIGRCKDFKETCDIVAKVGFKMFLNIVPQVKEIDSKTYSFLFEETPLSDYVEVPEMYQKKDPPLYYSNVICGCIRGALEMIQLQVEVHWVSDVLLGDEVSELRIQLVKVLEDEIPAGED
ncbi:transport protein particle 22 kDa subunit [Coelomomyces lativittatus]|nr:transport protein particle 22 kDa subunit [Coelomomyces lativittatus]